MGNHPLSVLKYVNERITCFDLGSIVEGEFIDTNPIKVFDMATSDIPSGLTLDFSSSGAGQTNRVHMMSKGKTSDEVYIVFSSSTLPTGWTEADGKLPAEGAYPGFFCGGEVFVRDMYRAGTLPDCVSSGAGFTSFSIYNVFYKFTFSGGALSNPVPFFVQENQLLPGHLGGGMATTDDGKVLWSVGDCLLFGTDGRFAPQVNYETCGKILLIDPDSPGSYDIVAKGIRNSQQMRIMNYKDKYPTAESAKDTLVFMDIGGVTAEEVNAKWMSKILNKKKIDNFGWGRSQQDGKAREGTFSVAPGDMGILGTEPPCEGDMEIDEAGYNQPWIQFGRTPADFFYAISSFSVGFKSFDKLHLIWSEFNTGMILGTTGRFRGGDGYSGPTTGYKIKLYDTNGTYLEGGLNDLVKEELGEVGYYRGDPRLFHYPDGTAGAFIERTGVFYKLTEIKI